MPPRDFPDLQPGRLAHVDELASAPREAVVGTTVRVLARVQRVDAVNDALTVAYHGAHLCVSTAYVGPLPGDLRLGSLYHFLGDLSAGADQQLVLMARLMIPMRGLNTDLYDRCLLLRREFEQKLDPAT